MGMECELKYVVPGERQLLLLNVDAFNLRIPGLQVEDYSGPFARSDFYYDTMDLALLKNGWVFRLGPREDGVARITFKNKTDDPRERVEISDLLPVKEARAAIYQTSSPLAPAIAALRDKIGFERLFPRLRVYKLFYSAHINGCEVVFGHTVFAGERGSFERIDLEVEAKGEATVKTIEEVGEVLSSRYALTLDMRSKYEVGMALVGKLPRRTP